MRIHNSLTGGTEELKPVHPGQIRMYVCGPTVYDEPHVGHVRSAFCFDVIRRVLEENYRVLFVRNVTDVDDKIIQRSLEENISPEALSEKYLKAYQRALGKMGILEPSVEPRATEPKHIRAMIRMIERLLEKGIAYEGAGHIYFRVRRFERYGELSHQDVNAMRQNVRIEPGEGKEDPLDFALWKKVQDGPFWDSPWGPGRPGWHIECSAMSTLYCGEEFDIHGGGQDLVFPHHENERAQAMAATGALFARLWMHHGLVTAQGRKMSKSLNHFVTLDQVLERHSVDAVRLFFLKAHYSSPLDFTWEKMRECDEVIKQFKIFFEKSRGLKKASRRGGLSRQVEEASGAFHEALHDDFNTPRALTPVFGILHEGNRLIREGKIEEAAALARWIREQSAVLGLFVEGEGAQRRDVYKDLLEKLMHLRNQKREGRNYRISDFIRKELLALGFKIGDRDKGSECLLHPDSPDPDLHQALEGLYEKAKGMK